MMLWEQRPNPDGVRLYLNQCGRFGLHTCEGDNRGDGTVRIDDSDAQGDRPADTYRDIVAALAHPAEADPLAAAFGVTSAGHAGR